MFPWQQKSRCHFVSFVTFITGAKFGDHCFNISGVILDSVFDYSSETIYDVIPFLICIIQNVNISKTKKYIPKRETPFVLTLKTLSNE